MLRLLAFVLVLANGAYFAWTQGYLAAYGFAPYNPSEPERVAQQIRPEAMRLLTSPAGGDTASPALAAAPASAPLAPASSAVAGSGLIATLTAAFLPTSGGQQASGPLECLQAGPFNDEQSVVLRTRLQSVLPAGGWVLDGSMQPVRWMVYMGKYSGQDAVAKKRAELRALHVAFEPLDNAALEPGLSLGSFLTQAEANDELNRIAKRGVRTAKVIQTAPGLRGQRLRLPAVDASLRSQLGQLQPQLAGKSFQSCG